MAMIFSANFGSIFMVFVFVVVVVVASEFMIIIDNYFA